MAVRELHRKSYYTGATMSHSIQADQLVSDESRTAPLGYSYQTTGKSFKRYLKLPKAEKYPLEIFSYTNLNFNSFAEKYPHFNKQFMIFTQIQNSISEFNQKFENTDLKWVTLCLERSNGRKIPRLQLDFHCKREELFEKA